MLTKLCKRCGQTKLLEMFPRDPRYKMGRFCWCSECRNLYNKIGIATKWKQKGGAA